MTIQERLALSDTCVCRRFAAREVDQVELHSAEVGMLVVIEGESQVENVARGSSGSCAERSAMRQPTTSWALCQRPSLFSGTTRSFRCFSFSTRSGCTSFACRTTKTGSGLPAPNGSSFCSDSQKSCYRLPSARSRRRTPAPERSRRASAAAGRRRQAARATRECARRAARSPRRGRARRSG